MAKARPSRSKKNKAGPESRLRSRMTESGPGQRTKIGGVGVETIRRGRPPGGAVREVPAHGTGPVGRRVGKFANPDRETEYEPGPVSKFEGESSATKEAFEKESKD